MMGARLVFEYHFANKADDELDLGIPLLWKGNLVYLNLAAKDVFELEFFH